MKKRGAELLVIIIIVFGVLKATGAELQAPMVARADATVIDEWTRVVSGVGFPIAVALYLLIRMEGVITKLTDAVNKLVTILAQKGVKIE